MEITPDIATSIRIFLETRWLDYWQKQINGAQNFRKCEKRSDIPEPLSSCMCQHTTLFLLRLLGEEWRGVGGYMVDRRTGISLDHWWLVCNDIILDLTADQFGWEKITIAGTSDFRYAPDQEMSCKSWLSGKRHTVELWENALGYGELVRSFPSQL